MQATSMVIGNEVLSGGLVARVVVWFDIQKKYLLTGHGSPDALKLVHR